jgi:hypothetical protein
VINEPDLDLLLRSTHDAFHDALRSLLDGDRHVARRVLSGSAARRAAVSAAQVSLRGRWQEPMTGRDRPRLVNELQFVADVGQVGRLVDHVARHVVAEGEPGTLTGTQRIDVETLLVAGERRLRQVADRSVGPSLDPVYRGCGGALFEVADRAARSRSTTATLCAALAVTLLQASRHAARAA